MQACKLQGQKKRLSLSRDDLPVVVVAAAIVVVVVVVAEHGVIIPLRCENGEVKNVDETEMVSRIMDEINRTRRVLH